MFWDQDKYANLSMDSLFLSPRIQWLIQVVSIGRFIQNHYREAVQAIHSLETELHVLHEQFGITDDAFTQYLTDKRKYLQDLTGPSPTTTLKSQYVQALNDLSQCRYEVVICKCDL
jgi:hypothetical protein